MEFKIVTTINKPFEELTIKDIKKICNSYLFCTDGCPFYDSNECMFKIISQSPLEWEFKEK